MRKAPSTRLTKKMVLKKEALTTEFRFGFCIHLLWQANIFKLNYSIPVWLPGHIKVVTFS